MGETSQIIQNIAGNLNSLADPSAALDLSGKTSIAVDKTVSFVDTIYNVFKDPREKAQPSKWNGKSMSTGKQREAFVKRGLEGGVLDSFARDNGFANAREMLPPHLQNSTQAAELYWANVMELAYLDARLMEPANRRLSDRDWETFL